MNNPLYVSADIIVVFHLFLVFLFISSNYKNKVLDYVFSLFITISISEGMKFFIDKPRPLMDLEGGSFPSTHSAVVFNAVFFVLLACHTLSKGLNREGKWSFVSNFIGSMTKMQFLSISFTFALVVGVLRIVSGAHYIIDVIAGSLIGFIIAGIFKYYDVSGRKIK